MGIKLVIRFNKGRIQNILLMLLFGIFFITKMLRGFSGSNVEGGIWNYIQILFVVLGFAIAVLNPFYASKQEFFLLLFTLLCLINALPSIKFTFAGLYSYLMIAYPFCIMLIMSKQKKDLNNSISIFIIIIYYAISFIYCSNMLFAGSYSTSIGTVADAYYILGLLPLVLFFQKQKIWIPISVCCISILLSGKRAGLIAFVIMVIGYFLIEANRTNLLSKAIKNVAGLLVISVLFLFLFQLLAKIYNVRLLTRFLDMVLYGDSSGRTVRWSSMWHKMQQSNIVEWFIGHGQGSTSQDFGGNAHNDFLEVMYNYGIAPFFTFIFFYFFSFIYTFKMIREKYLYGAQYFMSMVYSLVLSLFSVYFITPTYISCGMMCLGLINVDYSSKEQGCDNEH